MIQNFHQVLIWDVNAKLCNSSPECFKNILFYLKNERGRGGDKGFGLWGKTCVLLDLYLPVLYLQMYLFQMESQAECARPQLV